MALARLGLRQRFEAGALTAYATTALLVFSVGLNVIQARRLSALTTPPPILPDVGQQVPALQARTLDGRRVVIDVTKPTILYYFSPKCVWCERNWLNVKALIAATTGRYRFVGISTSADVEGYLSSHRLSFEVYTGVDPETARVYNFGGTPRTIVISGGKVEHVWEGAYVRQQADVERVYGIVLPGATPPPPRVDRP